MIELAQLFTCAICRRLEFIAICAPFYGNRPGLLAYADVGTATNVRPDDDASITAGLTLCVALCGARRRFIARIGEALEAVRALVQNGYAEVPRGPGLGIELDEDAVSEYAVNE